MMWSRGNKIVRNTTHACGPLMCNILQPPLRVGKTLINHIRGLHLRPHATRRSNSNAKFIQCCRQNSDFSRCSQKVGIFGAPMWKGQRKEGVDKGPNAIRSAGLLASMHELGIDVKDYGDLQFETKLDVPINQNARNATYIGAALTKVADQVSTVLRDKRTCVTLGGDHSIAMGTVLGHFQVYNDMCLLWVDAHADINTTATTNSGNIHGMPLSFILHEMSKYCQKVPGLDWIKPCVPAANLAYIGLRDVEPNEKAFLNKLKIPHYGMQHIDKLGIHAVINQALERINPKGNLSLHVSFDIDSLDKRLAPSTGTAVDGGLSLREALCIAEELASTGTLRCLDLVEVNPLLGSAEDVAMTVSAAIRIIMGFLGKNRDGDDHVADAQLFQ